MVVVIACMRTLLTLRNAMGGSDQCGLRTTETQHRCFDWSYPAFADSSALVIEHTSVPH